jgi:uncharacterized OB-fold protein
MEINPSRVWRRNREFLGLKGSNCRVCKEKHIPPRPVCPDCGAQSESLLEIRDFSPEGIDSSRSFGKERER